MLRMEGRRKGGGKEEERVAGKAEGAGPGARQLPGTSGSVVKNQEIQMVQTELQTRTEELSRKMVLAAQQSCQSPAGGAGSENMGGEKERVDGATNGRKVREQKGLQTILDG